MGAVKARRLIRSIARWTLAVMLFAQGALVANACLRLEASPQAAFTMSHAEMDGCEMGVSNPNACLLAYLDQTDYSSAQPTVPPATHYFLVPLIVAAPSISVEARAPLAPLGGAPPIPIRYCTLLI
jgi:hypothetical protein